MDKNILKKIAKDWCKSILLANEGSSFGDDSLLTIEEQNFILKETKKIAAKITNNPPKTNIEDIISQYYIIE